MLVTLICILMHNLFAKEVMSQFYDINNGLIPESVISIAYNQSISGTMDQRFNNSGQKVSNLNFNTQSLSFFDLAESAGNSFDQSLAKSAFRAYGINLSEDAGKVVNDININAKAETIMYAHGLSKKENLFVILPIVSLDMRLESSFKASPSYNNLISTLEKSGQYSRANFLKNVRSNPLDSMLAENNLRMPQEIKSLANIYLNYRRKTSFGVWDQFVVLPAGYKKRMDDFLDFKINERSLGFRQALGVDFGEEKHQWSFYGSYHLRLPFTSDYRIPKSKIDPFNGDVEKNVRIKYGDSYELSSQYTFSPKENIRLYSNLQYMSAFSDKYEGQNFSNSRYELLENETNSQSLNMKLGFSINTVQAFLSKKFLLPMDLNLQVSKNLWGRNSYVNDWVALNVMVFYK